MARTLLCEIVTPESILYTNEVQMVVATTTTGEIGIMPLHVPIVATLIPGEVRLRISENTADWEAFSISGGYIEVHEDKVLVLADNAVSVSRIDAARARASVERIEALLADMPADAEDEREEMIRDLRWAQIQLKAVEKRART